MIETTKQQTKPHKTRKTNNKMANVKSYNKITLNVNEPNTPIKKGGGCQTGLGEKQTN